MSYIAQILLSSSEKLEPKTIERLIALDRRISDQKIDHKALLDVFKLPSKSKKLPSELARSVRQVEMISEKKERSKDEGFLSFVVVWACQTISPSTSSKPIMKK